MPDGDLHIAEVPYPSGELRYRFAFVFSPDGTKRIRQGRFVEYHLDGTVQSEGEYAGGLEEGEWRDYHANGRLAAAGRYHLGREEGVWRFWDEQGRPEAEVTYVEGVEQPSR